MEPLPPIVLIIRSLTGTTIGAARAVGRGDRAAEPAAPGHDRNFRGLGGVESGADRGKGKHHVDDGGRAALGEVLDRGIGLIRVARRVDDGDLPADLFGGRLRAGDVARIVGLVRRDRDDSDQRLIGESRKMLKA